MSPGMAHLDVSDHSLDDHYDSLSRQTPAQRALRLVLWHGDLPLGEVDLAAGAWPGSPARFRQVAVQAMAASVGQRLGVAPTAAAPSSPEAPRGRSQAPRASALARLSDPLEALTSQRVGEQPAAAPPQRISVVICTRDRAGQLEQALRAVAALSPAPDEVLVVDNAPTSSATRDVVERFAGVRYVREQRPGLSAARNTGLLAASGDVIAFTDDDAQVTSGWMARLRDAFADPETMAVTGLVIPAALDTAGQVLFERHLGGFGRGYLAQDFDSAFFRRTRSRGVPVWRIGAGTNMAIRRQAFDLVGGFDERLGAGTAGCSEDSEMWYRLLAEGWRCRYEPAAVVFHQHRSELDEVRQQARAYLRGHVAALFVQYTRYGDAGNLRRALVTLPRWYARRFARTTFTADPTVTAEVTGYLEGVGRAALLLRPKEPTQPAQNGARSRRSWFLRRNPFPHPYTEGFYFRDKMRAIHRVAPPGPVRRVLEVGGGGSRLTALLYPGADVVTIDLEGSHGAGMAGGGRAQFLCADATRLPFRDGAFDAVTFFDVLEHIPDDASAVREAQRVLTSGGSLLVTCPNEHWRFPYYSVLAPVCPTDAEVMAEWGHVRRGYRLSELDRLVGRDALRSATFINPVTVVNHDLAFSRLPARVRRRLLAAMSPAIWAAYAVHRARWRGTETAAAWRAPLRASSGSAARAADPEVADAPLPG